jgi:hypothetical protein
MLGVVLVLASCAAAPESIAPSYVSPATYTSWSCKSLAEEYQRVDAALSTTSQQQRQARSGDIAGVILIGVPTSTYSGTNVASEVARLKGTREAIHLARGQKGCG